MSATDAVETDAGWVVLDRLGGRLALLAGDGDLVRTFGRKGEGPGELSAPVALAYTGERLVVAERSGRLVLFDREGAAAGVVRLRFPGCGAARVHDLLSAPDSLVMLTRCPRASGEVSARLELVTLDGGRRPLIEVAYNDLRHARVDPFRSPVVARVDGRLAIGFLPDRCLDVLDEDGTVERRLCYPEGRRRPFPDSALAVLRLIEERTGGRVEFAVPEHAPPFISNRRNGHGVSSPSYREGGRRWTWSRPMASPGTCFRRVSRSSSAAGPFSSPSTSSLESRLPWSRWGEHHGSIRVRSRPHGRLR